MREIVSQQEELQTRERGFSLIELLVVLSIVGILSAIGLNNYARMRERAQDAAAQSDYRNIRTAIEGADPTARRITLNLRRQRGPLRLPAPFNSVSISSEVLLRRLTVNLRIRRNRPSIRTIIIVVEHTNGTKRFRYVENRRGIREQVIRLR